jgi:hypothetical protein
MKALLFVLFAAAPGWADTTISGDLTLTGRMGVNTQVPRAGLEAQLSADDQFVLRVSSPDGSRMVVVDRAGRLSLGPIYPQARLDVYGTGDDTSVGLTLRAGNSTTTVLSAQIAFGMASTDTCRHNIRTSHAVSGSSTTMDFYLWNDTTSVAALGAHRALSLFASTYSLAGVHISPYGTADVDLEVSNGQVTGGGKIHRLSAATHSSRILKTDIAYFPENSAEEALRDVLALRHARFRYKAKTLQPIMRGLIYEEAPASILGEHATVVVDHRLMNLELALKAVHAKIASLEAKIARVEEKKRNP